MLGWVLAGIFNHSEIGSSWVFQCTVCGKQFTRKEYNGILKSHKNKQGYPCPGRTGIFVKKINASGA